MTAIQATWLAGAAAVVLPLPMRLGSIEEFVLQTRGLAHMQDVLAALARAGYAAHWLEHEEHKS